nr:unnamed protein product [Spirometra erinaceieuropaei]
MDDERLPKQLFYGDVATGSRRQGGEIRRYKDTLKSSLKRLQINTTNWEELARDRPTWRRTVKTGTAIYETNRIAAAKVKREARKSQLRPVRNAAAQPPPTCPRCQRTFRDRIGHVGHLRINCASRTAPTIVPPPVSTSSSPPPTNSDNSSEPQLPSSSSSSSSSPSSSYTAKTTAVLVAVTHIRKPDTTTDTTPETSDSRETGEPVPGAPKFTPRTRLHCYRTFTHGMGPLGHMRIRESETDRSPGTPTTSNTLTMPSPTLTLSSRVPISITTAIISFAADTDTADFSCPHCPLTFTSRIGLVGHLRIHRIDWSVKVSSLTLAVWNIRYNTLEWRTVLGDRELARHKADIAALSKTLFSKQGQLEEVGAGYNFFWNGCSRAELRDADVAFAIRNDIVG